MQVIGVGSSVTNHLGGQRALRPVGFLVFLVKLDVEVLVQQIRQTNPLFTEQLRANHGIEETLYVQIEIALQAAQVVVGGVEDFANRRVGKDRPQRAEVGRRKGIYQHGPLRGRNLYQADLFLVVVQ